MAESLHETKRRLSKDYLGRGNIHGLGIHQKSGAVRVYVTRDHTAEQDKILRQLEEDAAPYPVKVEDSDQAAAS